MDETPTLTVVTQTFTYRDENGEIVTVYEQLVHESPYNEYASPSKDHLLGTDDKGMDVVRAADVRRAYLAAYRLYSSHIETLIGIILAE